MRVPLRISEKWDFMNYLILVIELEVTFEVEFEPYEISLMKSFSDIKNIIANKLQ